MTELTLLGGAKVHVDFIVDKGRCRACNEIIYWAITENKNKMPICQDENGDFMSHFANCPAAKKFRKKKGEKI